MATFSENQVRQLYVATALKGANTHLVPADALGTIEVFPGTAKGEHMYFEYKSQDGIVRSDLINVAHIDSVTHTLATKMEKKLRAIKITPSAASLVKGEDYIVKVLFKNYIGLGEDLQEAKYGSVRITSAMAGPLSEASKKDAMLKALAEDLATNLANEVSPLCKVAVHSAETTSDPGYFDANGLLVIDPVKVKNTPVEKRASVIYHNIVDIDSIYVIELRQPWTLGKFAEESVNFAVQSLPVQDEDWADIKVVDSKETVNDGRMIADLEWFCKGERADQYRGVGYPNNFEYKGVANPETAYDIIDVAYHFEGDAEDVQKSPKVISIAIENGDAVTLLGRIKAGAGIA